jgi:PAS domain S-box-containing protein
VHGQALYTAILRDCRERHRAQAALRASESRLQRLMALLPDAVLVAAGERITFANEAACRLFGAPWAWFETRHPLELMHPDSRPDMQARAEALQLGTETPRMVEEKIVRADGSARTVETTTTPIEDHGMRAILIVMRDVSELRRARRELARSRDELRRLVANQERVRESERVRIARELHDDLQQTLAAIRLDVVGAAAQLQQRPDAVAPTLAAIDELVGNAIVSTRRIVNDLRPQLLDELGLVAALRSLAAQFAQRTGLHAHVSVTGLDEDQALPSTLSICLYRVAQEALNNVAKHAQATTVELQLLRQGRRRVLLRVRDDGRGMAPSLADKPQSFGLLGMRERVRAFDGELRISSAPHAGTTIEASLPWTPETIAKGDTVTP